MCLRSSITLLNKVNRNSDIYTGAQTDPLLGFTQALACILIVINGVVRLRACGAALSWRFTRAQLSQPSSEPIALSMSDRIGSVQQAILGVRVGLRLGGDVVEARGTRP